MCMENLNIAFYLLFPGLYGLSSLLCSILKILHHLEICIKDSWVESDVMQWMSTNLAKIVKICDNQILDRILWNLALWWQLCEGHLLRLYNIISLSYSTDKQWSPSVQIRAKCTKVIIFVWENNTITKPFWQNTSSEQLISKNVSIFWLMVLLKEVNNRMEKYYLLLCHTGYWEDINQT